MKRFWNDSRAIFLFFILWRLYLAAIQLVSGTWFLPQKDFRGPVPWANFDGVHYLVIAREHYYPFQQAFFPFYPLLIRLFTLTKGVNETTVALWLSHILLLGGMYLFIQLNKRKTSLWPLALLLLFPTSFYYASVYPESLYFALASATLVAIAKHKWMWAGVAGMLASGTRLFGLYLLIPAILEYSAIRKKNIKDMMSIALIPMGLIGYMIYLWQTVGDPLAFFHVQSAFGANRSGDQFISTPQVLWRYIKIFATADVTSFQFKIAMFEFTSFLFSIFILIRALQTKFKSSYIWYCIAVLITPTLTGTLSSFPRYLLSAFPLFLVLDAFSNREKILLAILFGLTLVYFTSAFLQGNFVA